jgi:hypothetical protein
MCEHGDTAIGYYTHPDQNVMVAFCTKCYEREHPLRTEPFVTRYGQKLLEQEQGPHPG